MKNLFKINIFTYLFLLLSMLSGYFREIIIVYFILFFHELGHFFLMKFYKINVNKITFYPYGGMIDSNMLINTNSKKVLIISLGGIIMQLILYLVVFMFYKFNLINSYYYLMFIKYNFYILIFNLIPLYPLDGFKIFNSFFELFLPFRVSLRISFILNIIFLIMFMYYLYVFNINNYAIVIFLLISLINYIKDIKFIINKFYLERVIYDLKYNGLISVKYKKDMYKNKYNYINGVKEREFLENGLKMV